VENRCFAILNNPVNPVRAQDKILRRIDFPIFL
jgi:hypothetical protein